MKKKAFAAAAALATVASVAVPAVSQARSEYCGYTQVSPHTSCAFARNVVADGWESGFRSTWVYSPVTHQSYPIRYWYSRGTVTATGPNGIWLRFNY